MLERDRCKITIDLAVENYFAHPIGINSEGAFLVSIFMHWGFHEISWNETMLKMQYLKVA